MQGSAQAVSIGGEPSPPGRCCRRETGAEQYNVALPAALSGCRIPAHLPVRCHPLQRRVPGKTARLTGPPRRPFLAALSLTLSHSHSRFRVSAPRVNPGSELREARPPSSTASTSVDGARGAFPVSRHYLLRKGQLNRHTRYRPATTTRNTATQRSCHSVD